MVLETKSGQLQYLHYLHPSSDSLVYVLMHPRGEEGFTLNIPIRGAATLAAGNVPHGNEDGQLQAEPPVVEAPVVPEPEDDADPEQVDVDPNAESFPEEEDGEDDPDAQWEIVHDDPRISAPRNRPRRSQAQAVMSEGAFCGI